MSAPFAQISQGPPSTTGKVTSPQGLYLDRQNNIVGSAGDGNVYAAHQMSRDLRNAQSALTAVTTAQTLWSKTLNPGELNMVGRCYTLSGYGIYTFAGSSTPNITFVLSAGAVTLATIVAGPLNTAASTNMPFDFNFQISTVSTGASGTLEVHGDVDMNLTANTPAGVMSYFRDVNAAVSGAVNLLTAETLTLTVAAGNAIGSIQLRFATLEVTA